MNPKQKLANAIREGSQLAPKIKSFTSTRNSSGEIIGVDALGAAYRFMFKDATEIPHTERAWEELCIFTGVHQAVEITGEFAERLHQPVSLLDAITFQNDCTELTLLEIADWLEQQPLAFSFCDKQPDY